MRPKIVLMVGGTETLDFFSRQMNLTFQKIGYQTFLFDQQKEEDSMEKLKAFVGYADTNLVTFNFEGLSMDDCFYDGDLNLFWDVHDVNCVNIAVDHPFYYNELIEVHPKNFYQVSIDKLHRDYLKKFYPNVKSDIFLPLGGTSLYPDYDYPSVDERDFDVLFTGNFTPKEEFDQYIERNGDEYAVFYRSMIDELIKNPSKPDDAVMEEHLRREFPDAPDKDICGTIANMIFIDTYIRFYFREKVVKTLLDHKIHVHCIGKGWDRLTCKYPEYLTYEEDQASLGCLKRMTNAKISLNVMPWFKNGAHDRVFNAMANGAVCVTDHSIYLDEQLTDNENVIFYDLSDIEALPKRIKMLLCDSKKQEKIAQNAYTFTMHNHTWAQRAETLHKTLLK